jgi:probable F420-dependent oxidoreductase
MNVGLTLLTHGVMTRDDEGDCFLQNISPDDMAPVASAVRAEELGFHSVWFSDHVVTERVTRVGEHPANLSGKRAYPERPVLLDIPTTIGAVASRTTTLRFSPSVYIAPYRHPLITAHEFATLDVLSGGRVILGVGVGWEKGEFAAMGAEFDHRGAITDECIQIYKLAWTEPWIEFHGRFFHIENVSMDPKPVQDPHPPIWYGGVSRIGARRAARSCDAFYPMFLDAVSTPETFEPLREEIVREAERIGRDLTGFRLGGFCQVRLDDHAESDPRFAFSDTRPLLAGSAEQILGDLQVFADAGYSHVTVHLDCPSGTAAEWREQLERFAAEVLPEAQAIQHTDRL